MKKMLPLIAALSLSAASAQSLSATISTGHPAPNQTAAFSVGLNTHDLVQLPLDLTVRYDLNRSLGTGAVTQGAAFTFASSTGILLKDPQQGVNNFALRPYVGAGYTFGEQELYGIVGANLLSAAPGLAGGLNLEARTRPSGNVVMKFGWTFGLNR